MFWFCILVLPLFNPQMGGPMCIRCTQHHLPLCQCDMCCSGGQRRQQQDRKADLEASFGQSYSQ